MRNEQRLAPRVPPFPEDLQRTLARMMGPAQDIEPLALFRTIAHNGALLDRFRGFGAAMLAFGHLPDDERETLIHRTTARCGAGYEWGVHATLFAPPLGLGEKWLRATWHGTTDDPAFTPRQALLVRAADELHDRSAWSDATWSALRESYDDETLVEIACLAGFYHLVSFLCGAFSVTPEAWARGIPAEGRTRTAR
jgi:4-carboxymuconolactone decarboxylase